MRKYLLIILVFISSISCQVDHTNITSIQATSYKPVLMNRSDLDNSIKLVAPKSIQSFGRIYQYSNFILISDNYQGVHIFDNTDNKNPKNLGFLVVPGCLDIAVKDGILFVANATDLISIDLNDPSNPKLNKRIKDIFPEIVPPDNGTVPSKYSTENRPSNTVIVNWVK